MKISILLIAILFALSASSQSIDPNSIDIVRDSSGVPHIYSKTDAGVAYGLAWAHSEDDFKTIQQGYLASKSMLGRLNGKAGATVDYIVQLLRCRQLVDSLYEKDISQEYKKILEAYCDGINAYATAHPKEVLLTKLFPVTPKDMLTYSVLQLAISCGVDGALSRINNGTIPLAKWEMGGSNAFAFNSKITADGQTYIAINSHQPLQGPVAWYEAHLCSEEGWNILGALFPGSPNILLGCNENLAWAHTVNYPDKLDVYQLELNPDNELEYKFDGRWKKLEVTQVKLNVKVSGIILRVNRKAYNSVYGPTLVTKRGAFSIRTGGLMDIRALEQWFHMNKARNFTEFYRALNMGAIPGYNVVYADRYDTIYYLSNGKLPFRNPEYSWRGTLPGNTSKTLWNEFHPLTDLPQLLQPASGYLFNSNHSPFNASAPTDNISVQKYDPTMSFETNDNNRSLRFMELISRYPKISYEDFKTIKYDRQLPAHLAYRTNSDTLFQVHETDAPDVQDLIHELNSWNRQATLDSKGAAIFLVIYYKVVDELQQGATYRSLSRNKSIELLRYTRQYLLKNFRTTSVSLGQYQKLVRGDKAIPLPGIPDVIASMLSVPYKNGMVKGEQGESYIELVRFTPNGPVIESINCYGASSKPGAPHFDDQMELFVNQKTKPMSLDREKVYKGAKSIYHPRLIK